MTAWKSGSAVLILIAGLLLSQVARAADPESEAAASDAAEAWLALVDAGRYGESWDAAAAYFKNVVGRDQWIAALNGVRRPLGSLRSRQLGSRTFATSLPGAPDGAYVVIQFRTAFEHKQASTETVTPMLDPDGVWRVSGYYIR